jgi:polar amino acid transport system permease protein
LGASSPAAGRGWAEQKRSTRQALVLGGLLLIVVLVAACSSGRRAAAYQYNWDIFFNSLFAPDPRIIRGLLLTVSIAVTAQIIGVVLGVFGAMGRLARARPVRAVANAYVWVFRGTPLLVQIMIIYFGLLNTNIFRWDDISLNGFIIAGAVQAGIFALGVNEGAYMTEIVRAGIISIDPGQMEAAKSLGMTYGKAMRRIILPQAARVIVPPLGNEFNNMLKTTSLLTVVSVPELFVTFQQLNGNGPTSFHPFELFLACALWFLLLTTIWSVIQGYIERRLARGTPGAPASGGPGLRDRLFGFRRPDLASSAGTH